MTGDALPSKSAFDPLAEHWYRFMSTAPQREFALRGDGICGVENALARIRPGATVLDCACGPGLLVLDLLARGYNAYGLDGSAGMIDTARRHGFPGKMSKRLFVAEWQHLPEKLRRRFDLVICSGASLHHCPGDGMVAALRGMYAVLKPGGLLFLDGQDWEVNRRNSVHYWAYPSDQTEDGRVTWLLHTHYPRYFHQAHTVEIIIMCENAQANAVQHFPVTIFPFRFRELARRLKRVGFDELETSSREGAFTFGVIAHKARGRWPGAETQG